MMAAAFLLTTVAPGLQAPPARRKTEDDRGTLIAQFASGGWSGNVRYMDWRDWADHRVTCSISTNGATLFQIREGERDQMRSGWYFWPEPPGEDRPIAVDRIRVGNEWYEVTNLPWRLATPSGEPEAMVTAQDVYMLAYRRDRTRQWLPLAYLTDALFEARQFEIGYRFDDLRLRTNDRKRSFDLRGFREVAKWCGRQLLFDRQDQNQVRKPTQ
jgi:hypothetical protein